MAITYHAGRRIQGLSTEVLDTASTIWGTNANQATEDFTTYTDQTDANASWISTNTTYVKGGYTTKKMDMSFRGSNSGLISYDLGVGNVSDTNWILRFTLNYTTYTSGDALGQHWVGLSSLDSSSAYTVNQDSVSIWLNRAGQMKSCSSDNNEMQTNTGADGTDLVISTLYYVDLIRDGTTATYNIYDDSERTSLFSTSTHTIAGTVSGLRYFVVKPEGAGTPGTGNAVGTIDDIVFYNGISSITSKPTNVQVGSRFEETDTRKMYNMTDDYKVHSFTTTGNTTFAVTGSGDVEYLVIGGGGGGSGYGGGGGAGDYRTATGHAVTAQSYTITVGAGGVGSLQQGSDGGSSIFSTITSAGGGYGGSGNTSLYTDGNSGGSGGGGGQDNNRFGVGGSTTAYGNIGGDGVAGTSTGSGGGGGSSQAGANYSTTGGKGGDGTASSITGSSITRSGGGGGSKRTSGSAGAGGSGGGGAGSVASATGTAGTVNTGSGGGGAGVSGLGGSGGSGVVIIRYKTSSSITATGGTITDIVGAWTEEGT